MQTDITIATRHYHDFDPKTGEQFELQDRMVRKPCGSFVLYIAGEKPCDPEICEPFSLERVFEWLRELPCQIERTVIAGSQRGVINMRDKSVCRASDAINAIIFRSE
jgi:hypothetical protein